MKIVVIALALALTGCAQLSKSVNYKDGVAVNGDQKAYDACIAKGNLIKRCLDAAR